MNGVGVGNKLLSSISDALEFGWHFVVRGYAFFLFLNQLDARETQWRSSCLLIGRHSFVCLIVSSVCVLPVWWVTYKIIISFIFSVSFVCSFLLFGMSLRPIRGSERMSLDEKRTKTKKTLRTERYIQKQQENRRCSCCSRCSFFFSFSFSASYSSYNCIHKDIK